MSKQDRKHDIVSQEQWLEARRAHFMNPALLDSQFAALEEPADAIVADIGPAPEAIAAAVLAQLA